MYKWSWCLWCQIINQYDNPYEQPYTWAHEQIGNWINWTWGGENMRSPT